MIIAIILIGGSGERFGAEIPKQFTKVLGKDMFIYTTEVFQNNIHVDEIAVVYPHGWQKYVTGQCEKFKLTKVKYIIEGGKTRQDSGYNAVKYLVNLGYNNPLILEHDGDRILVDNNIINKCIECCRKNGNALACINSSDYIIEGTPANIVGNIKTKVKRHTLRTHTPCTFYLNDLYKIYEFCKDNNINNMSMPCDIALDMGKKVYPVNSTTKNGIKLVTQEDFEIIKLIIENGQR